MGLAIDTIDGRGLCNETREHSYVNCKGHNTIVTIDVLKGKGLLASSMNLYHMWSANELGYVYNKCL